MENVESIQIHLNSKFASSYNNLHFSDCDFTTSLIQISDKYTIYLSVVNAVIPYSFYNVNSTNNILYYQELTSPTVTNTTIFIPYGNYNVNQLATYLAQNLPRTNVSYDPIKNKLLILQMILKY